MLHLADALRPDVNSAHRVDSNVHIGGVRAAESGYVPAHGITRVVRLIGTADGAASRPGVTHPGVVYLSLPALDDPAYDIRNDAVAALRFIRAGLRHDEQILVGCHAGVSRSATVVLFHLMLNRGLTLDEALRHLRRARPYVRPNPGFMAHLAATDRKIRRRRAKRG